MAQKVRTASEIFDGVLKENPTFAVKDRYRFISPTGKIVWESNPGPQTDCLYSPAFEILFGGQRGGGKLSPLDSVICTPKGFVRMGDIEVGDLVTDPTTGGQTTVIAVHPHPEMKIWKLKFDDGAELEVGEDHLWLYRLANHHRPSTKSSSQRKFANGNLGRDESLTRWDRYRVGHTRQLIDAFEAGNGVRIPLTDPVMFTKTWRPRTQLSPYEIGLILGDGHIHSAVVTNVDKEIRDYLLGLGYTAHKGRFSMGATGQHRRNLRQFFGLHGMLNAHSWEKFIPDSLKLSTVDVRLELLQGLMDTDGTVDKRGQLYFLSTSKRLAEDVQWIVRSLGGKAVLRNRQTSYTHKEEKKNGRPSFQIRIWHPKTSSLFRLSRKRARCTDSWNGGRELSRELVSVEYVGEKPARCITVSSPYGLYVANDFIVTHNSDGLIAFMIKGDRSLPASNPLHHSYVNHPFYRGIVFRQNATDLEEYISRCDFVYSQLGAKLCGKPAYFEFPTGARIYMNHLGDEGAADKAKGPSYIRIGVEELTLIARKGTYLRILGSCRSPIQEMKPQIMSTTNPDGPGQWVKDRFVEVFTTDGKMIPWGTIMYEPVTKLTRVFIPSKLSDNPYLRQDRTYVGVLMSQEDHLRKAWLDGDWNALSGSYFTEFRPKGPRSGDDCPEANHVIPANSVALQPYYSRWLSGDWGYRHFAAFYKFCQQPGGHLYCYDEFVRKDMGSFELGIELAKWCIPDLDGLPEHQMELYLSPDAFGKRDGARPIAAQIQAGIDTVLGPGACFLRAYSDDERAAADMGEHAAAHAALESRYSQSAPNAAIVISQANNDRIAGLQYIRELMRWRRLLFDAQPDLEYAARLVEEKGHLAYQQYLDLFKNRPKDEVLPVLQICGPTSYGAGGGCPALIKSLQALVHDTRPGKNPEDAMRVEGDDPADGFRYGAMAHRDMAVRIPKSFWVGERMERARTMYQDPTILGQIAAMQNAKYDRQFAPAGPVTFPRRGSPQHWGVQ